ncbi:EEF1A lysine methyltransferase 2 isoform X1 [Pipra filicauda]|uniref:EEF1A lysine methyltransferase 2 isoform X1 n=1 Tax=Pipra filicauda TaxID=649802 RepID=A0A7R5KZ55_9PASS|nr:EEF1A lysine methyltransferase 2 isoform X1 [Pipra filicauda]
MLHMRENCKLFKTLEMPGKSGLERKAWCASSGGWKNTRSPWTALCSTLELGTVFYWLNWAVGKGRDCHTCTASIVLHSPLAPLVTVGIERAGSQSQAKSGYVNLTGIDYSPSAIQLSEKVREKEGMSNIKLKVEDFLAPSAELSGFDICIDKGTFDAISLNPDDAAGKRRQYVRSLCRVLKPQGFFLITSCNWTKEELLDEFREGFEILEELPTPKFCFGGRIGNSVTALVFQRKKTRPSILDKLD